MSPACSTIGCLRALALCAATALLCAGCGPEPRTDATDVEEYSAGCRGLTPPVSSGGLQLVTSTPRYQILADPGVLACAPMEQDALNCTARGPGRIFVQGETDGYGYILDADDTARFAVGPNGALCNLTTEP